MKKTLSYVLVLFILITMIPATAVPVQADTTTDDLILDFTNDTTISDFGFSANTVDGEKGAKWEYANLKSSEKYLYFHHNDIVTNWKAYTAIKIRLHSASANDDKLTVLLPVGNLASGGYFYYQITLNWSGWKDVTISFDEFACKNGVTTDFWGSVKGIVLYRGNEWVATGEYNSETVVHIGSVSLCGKTVSNATYNPLLLDFEDDATIKEFIFESSKEHSLFGHKSAKWDFAKSGGSIHYNYFTQNSLQTNWSEYKTLNLWAYNTSADDNHFTLVFPTTGSIDGYWRKEIATDWTGWKKLSIPLSDFLPKVGTTSWDQITGVIFHAGLWSESYEEINKDTCLYFEKMYLEGNTGEYVIGEFSAGTDGFSNLTSETDQTRMYSASVKWDNMTTNSTVTKSYTDAVDLSGYTMFNAWIYSEKANGADMNIVLNTTKGIKNKKENNAWYIYAFKIDWVGWKLISVPIKEFTPTYSPKLNEVTSIQFDSRNWGSQGGPLSDTVLYFDRIWMGSQGEVPATPSANITDGSQISAGTKNIALSYDSELSPYIAQGAVTVQKNSSAVSDFHVATDNNKLDISFENYLEPGASYSISVNNIYNVKGHKATAYNLNFTVKTNETGNVTLSVSDGVIKASAVVSSKTGAEGVLVLAVYDAGVLKDVQIEEVPMTSSYRYLDVSSEISGNQTAKAMLWDNMSSLKPIADMKIYEPNSVNSLSLPSVFADGAVIQRDKPLTIWGKGTTNDEVTVSLDGKSYPTIVDGSGNWSVTADAVALSDTPYTLEVSDSDESITINGLLAGDVWLLGGQSNMARTLSTVNNSETEIANANYENIRFFSQDISQNSVSVQDDVTGGKWQECTSANARTFSGLGYLFGKELHNDLGVPIGLINTAVGGTAIESWIGRDSFKNAGKEDLSNIVLSYPASSLYNSMLAPLAPYGLKGFIWYQGEANCPRHEEYLEAQELLLDSWRGIWGENLPFIYAQIPAYSGDSYLELAYIREAQLKLLDRADNVAMAVFPETGEAGNIHPMDKQTAAYRMALAAKSIAYNMDVQYLFPKAKEKSISGNNMLIKFDGVYDGLAADGTITGFEICGEDGIYYSAEAEISSANTITVHSDRVAVPVGVRYGFCQFPEINLYNSVGLSASPFRME